MVYGLQLRLELRRTKFLLLQTHAAEDILGLGLLARDARLDFVFTLPVLATAELVEMGCTIARQHFNIQSQSLLACTKSEKRRGWLGVIGDSPSSGPSAILSVLKCAHINASGVS